MTNLKKHEDISSINKMPRDEIKKKNPIKKLKTKQIENKRRGTKSDIKTKQNQMLRDEIKKKINSKNDSKQIEMKRIMTKIDIKIK
jgi:ribosomal protein L2